MEPDTGDRALGAWMKQVRERRGLTQADVAKALGIKQPNVNRMERGKQRVGADQLFVIERFLGATYGKDQPSEVFESGFAAGEFDALAAMASAISERAVAARDRLRGGATPDAYEAIGTRARRAVAETPPAGSAKAPRRKASSR